MPRGLVECGAGPRQIARRQWIPRDEADAVPLAVLQHILAATVGQVVAVLHGSHREHAAGRFDFLYRNFAQSCVADHAFIDQLPDRRELLIGRDTRGYVALYRYLAVIDTALVLAIRAQREGGYAPDE